MVDLVTELGGGLGAPQGQAEGLRVHHQDFLARHLAWCSGEELLGQGLGVFHLGRRQRQLALEAVKEALGLAALVDEVELAQLAVRHGQAAEALPLHGVEVFDEAIQG